MNEHTVYILACRAQDSAWLGARTDVVYEVMCVRVYVFEVRRGMKAFACRTRKNWGQNRIACMQARMMETTWADENGCCVAFWGRNAHAFIGSQTCRGSYAFSFSANVSGTGQFTVIITFQ